MLGRAFMDDPLFAWVAPEEQRRARFLTTCMTAFARYATRHGLPFVTPGEIAGAALWLPPGGTDVGRVAMLRSGIIGAMLRLGVSGSMRFAKAGGVFEGAHERAMGGGPHWYLMDLGVEPARQGQGIGGGLIQPVLRRAHERGHACYLETVKERNLDFYRRHGFEVVSELRMPDDAPPAWNMLRTARG